MQSFYFIFLGDYVDVSELKIWELPTPTRVKSKQLNQNKIDNVK